MPAIALTLHEPNTAPRTIRLDTDSIVMGRATSCTLPIKGQYLSRKHAEIRFDAGAWVVQDLESANGTFVNGVRIAQVAPLSEGDCIRIGDAEVVIGEESVSTDAKGVARAQESVSMLSMAAMSSFDQTMPRRADRSTLVQRLAMELIEDRPMSELFELIADRIMAEMTPSRVALALLKDDGHALDVVKVRRASGAEPRELTISTTLLHEVINNRNIVFFTDASQDERFADAFSIMGESIRSTICAPLLAADNVLGVLYIDYRVDTRKIGDEEVKLVGQIARIAAMKLESTRLREAALERERLEGSLRLARDIQMRMIPRELPPLRSGAPFDIGAEIRPAKHVGGDFYDFHIAGNSLYFCIADVSGKGVPAALMMAVTRTLIRSLILTGASPREIVTAVNQQLCAEADPSMFVTAFVAVLDLESGVLRHVNCGHNRPLLITLDGTVHELTVRSGLALGCLSSFDYVEEGSSMRPGEMIYLYTDGISEATNPSDEMFSEARLKTFLRDFAEHEASQIAAGSVSAVEAFARGAPQSDDLAVLCIRYFGLSGAN